MPRIAGPGRLHRLLLIAALLVGTAQVALPRPVAAGEILPGQVGIDNFGQVNDHMFRGAQPDREAFARLGSLGVKTVIDLQKDGEGDEPAWVAAAGMRYVKIPLSSHHPATADQTDRFLALVNDPDNWPVYVHCAGGRHRTGEMTGIYRITHDGWTADMAYAEMKQYGYYSFPFHGSLKKYVYRYYDALHAAPAGGAATKGDASRVATTCAASCGPSTP